MKREITTKKRIFTMSSYREGEEIKDLKVLTLVGIEGNILI